MKFMNVVRGIRNVVRWSPIVWDDKDFDYAYLLRIMEYKFRRMAERNERSQITTDWEEQSKQLRACENLCRRICDDDYDDLGLIEKDCEQLGQIIGANLCGWWD